MRGNTFRPHGSGDVAVIGGEELRPEASCLADDVVIDFPSVLPAVDRMRRAFLADERPASHDAIVQLTPREAMRGAVVPLEVPVRCTCRQCGGRGESWTEACSRCNGRGLELLRHLLQVRIPAGVIDGARFCFTVIPRHNPPTRIELHVLVA